MEIIKPKSPLSVASEFIDTIMVKDGHLTFLQESSKFQEQYSNIKNNLNEFIEFKEDEKGIKVPTVNITGNVDFIDKDLLKRHNGKSLTSFSTDVFNELKTNALNNTSNPYAQAKLNQNLNNVLSKEREDVLTYQAKLKNTYNISAYNTFLEKSVNNTSLQTYRDDILNATKALNLSNIDPNTKIKLQSGIQKVFSSYLVEKLSYEDPLKFITLHQANPNHDIFTSLEPHEKYKYLKHATQYIKTENNIKIANLETELPNKLKSAEQYRQIDKEFFKEYISALTASGNTRKVKKISNEVLEATSYYDFYHGGQSFDVFELKKRFQDTFYNIKADDPDLSIKLKLKDRIGSEINQLEKLQLNDPAKYQDELMLMGVANTKLLEGQSQIEKRIFLGSPRILTNNERDDLVGTLSNKQTREEFTMFNNALFSQYGPYTHQILSELSESKNVDLPMKFIIKSYINDNNHNVQNLFNLREKDRNGSLKEDLFPTDVIKNLKERVYIGDTKELDALQSLPAEKARGMLDFIYLSAKDNFAKNKDEKQAVKQAIKNVLEDNYYINTKSEIVVPKQIYNAQGTMKIERHEADKVANNLEDLKTDKNYWNDLKIASLTGVNLFEFIDVQREHYIKQFHNSIGNGQFVLDEEKGGYIFQFEMNGRLFYDANGGEKKVFTIKDVLDQEYQKDTTVKTLNEEMSNLIDYSKAIELANALY